MTEPSSNASSSRPKPKSGSEAGAVKSFCSERCFTNFRRAAFKRTKACDWCDTKRDDDGGDDFVTIVDQDTQMQFCKYVGNKFSCSVRERSMPGLLQL